MKIAIFASASPQITDKNLLLAQNIGIYLAEKGITIITGGCVGLPSAVARSAFSAGAETIAYYPDLSERDLLQNAQVHNNDLSSEYTHKRFFKGFTYRSVRMVEDADGAVVFNGRFCTLSELSIAVEKTM